MPGRAETVTFEEAVGRLEEIVVSLETGALPLGESLRRFEEAIGLSRLCAAQLQEAEAKINVLAVASADAGEATPRESPARAVSRTAVEAPMDTSGRSPSAGWDPFAEE